jgi:hypothetical protein
LALWFFDEAADGDFGLAHVRLKALTGIAILPVDEIGGGSDFW